MFSRIRHYSRRSNLPPIPPNYKDDILAMINSITEKLARQFDSTTSSSRKGRAGSQPTSSTSKEMSKFSKLTTSATLALQNDIVGQASPSSQELDPWDSDDPELDSLYEPSLAQPIALTTFSSSSSSSSSSSRPTSFSSMSSESLPKQNPATSITSIDFSKLKSDRLQSTIGVHEDLRISSVFATPSLPVTPAHPTPPLSIPAPATAPASASASASALATAHVSAPVCIPHSTPDSTPDSTPAPTIALASATADAPALASASAPATARVSTPLSAPVSVPVVAPSSAPADAPAAAPVSAPTPTLKPPSSSQLPPSPPNFSIISEPNKPLSTLSFSSPSSQLTPSALDFSILSELSKPLSTTNSSSSSSLLPSALDFSIFSKVQSPSPNPPAPSPPAPLPPAESSNTSTTSEIHLQDWDALLHNIQKALKDSEKMIEAIDSMGTVSPDDASLPHKWAEKPDLSVFVPHLQRMKLSGCGDGTMEQGTQVMLLEWLRYHCHSTYHLSCFLELVFEYVDTLPPALLYKVVHHASRFQDLDTVVSLWHHLKFQPTNVGAMEKLSSSFFSMLAKHIWTHQPELHVLVQLLHEMHRLGISPDASLLAFLNRVRKSLPEEEASFLYEHLRTLKWHRPANSKDGDGDAEHVALKQLSFI